MSWIEALMIIGIVSATFILIFFLKKLSPLFSKFSLYKFIVPSVLLLFFTGLVLSSSYWSVYLPPNKTYINIQDLVKIFWWLALYWLTFLCVQKFLWQELLAKSDIYVPRIIKDFVNVVLLFTFAACISHFVYHSNLIGFFTLTSVMAVMLGYSAQILTNDIFSGIGLNLIRQFKPGDWIKLCSMNIIGKVEEINSRFVLLTTLDNDVYSIPNSVVGQNAIQNFSTQDKLFHIEFELPICFAHSPVLVKRLIDSAIAEISEVNTSQRINVQLNLIRDNRDWYTFVYKITFFSSSVDIDEVKDKVLTNIWYKFQKINISFPNDYTLELAFPKEQEVIAFLLKCELFSTLSEKELKFLSKSAELKFFGPPERILQQNTESSSLYIIYSGGVDIYLDLENGVRKKVASLPQGSYFGEMSLLTGQLTIASVNANAETYIIQITHKAMAKLFKDRPELIEQISEIIVERQMSNKEFMAKHKAKRQEKAGLISSMISSIKHYFSF